MLLGVGFIGCTNTSEMQSDSITESGIIVNQTTENMKNLVSIVEIPISDFSRAVKFYQTILNVTIDEVDMAGTKLGVLPSDDGAVSVVLAKGDDYKPTTEGALLYLNAGKDLQPMLDKIAKSGGQVIVPKTEINGFTVRSKSKPSVVHSSTNSMTVSNLNKLSAFLMKPVSFVFWSTIT